MTTSIRVLCCALLFVFSNAFTQAQAEGRKIADLPKDREVKYSTDIYPVLKKNCVACHNASTDEGGINLESVAKMQEADVDVLVPGKSDTSLLFMLAAHIEEPIMPPEDNDVAAAPLSPEELALLKRWIDMGAKVDDANPGRVKYEWQPLPPHLRTVYASTMTQDGRLAAASFGNQIRVFGGSASTPIQSLELAGKDGKPTTPHLDFVQDLSISEDGRQLISAGFRNVKVWRFNGPQTLVLPEIRKDASLACSVNATGTHLASLSPRGEITVGKIGEDRWQWLKSFAAPDAFKAEEPVVVHLAIDNSGEAVAIAWDKEIRIARSAAKDVISLTSPQPISAIVWDREGRLVTGDAAAGVTFWLPEGDTFKPQADKVVEGHVAHLLTPAEGDAALIALDQKGNIATWAAAETKAKSRAKLPAPSKFAAATRSGNLIWTTLETGAFGHFDFASNKFVEKSKLDPQAVDGYTQANWSMLVGERLVAATEAELKTAQTNEASEKKNIENATKDIEAKTKARDDKKKPADDSKKASDAAKAKLTAEQTKEKETNEKRKQLAEKIKQIDAAAPALTQEKDTATKAAAAVAAKMAETDKQRAAVEAEMKKKLAELDAAKAEMLKAKTAEDQKAAAAQKKIDDGNAQKAAADKELKALPAEKALADAVKAATAAADKAAKDAETKDGDLKKAQSALELAEEAKQRGENRLKEATDEVGKRQKLVEAAKQDQEGRKKNAETAKAAQDTSLGTDAGLAMVADANLMLAKSGTSGLWNLFTASGDWLTSVSEIPSDSQLVASGGSCVLTRAADGTIAGYRVGSQLWVHGNTIGSATEESPFADRVLSVDVDPSGKLLATGGGEPSRNGELHIWDTSDGSMVRKIENPHTDTILCVCFSPDGKTLASSSSDRMIKLWDVATGKLIKTLEGHTHHVNSIAWNVNNRKISSASADASVKIWDISTGQSTRTITGLNTELTRLVYVGRDQRVGLVSGDNYFRVYRTDNGGRETNAKVAEGYLYALASNRDGTKFLVGGADGKAKIVDKAGKELVNYE